MGETTTGYGRGMVLGGLSRIDASSRDESRIERLDRNWTELLQELRVAQTGVQLLTGFLLTLPFQARFGLLQSDQRVLYVVIVGLATAATICLVMPVMLHRLLFRLGARAFMVAVAHVCAIVGGSLLGLATVGATCLLFDVVLNDVAAVIAGVVTLLAVLVLWVIVPLTLHRYVERRYPVKSTSDVIE